MATRVIMPKQGNTVETCLIASWLRRKGEPVEQGEPLLEIETDKALVEVESPASGVLLETFFDEGDEVPVQTTIAVIGRAGESVEGFAPERAGAAAGSAPAPPVLPAAVAASGAPPASTPAPPAPAPAPAPMTGSVTGIGGRAAPVSPRARKLAARFGLEPGALPGSGPAGRVVERDVERALRDLAAGASGAATDAPAAPDPDAGPDAGDGVLAQLPPESGVTAVPLTGVRRRTAERMRASLLGSAQLTLDRPADAEGLLAFRRSLKASPEHLGVSDITVNDLLLFAVVRALLDHPDLNALFVDGTLYRLQAIHLGVAVDTPRGLLVPVVHHAERLGLKALSRRAASLIAQSRDGRIDPALLRGGSFSVTNLGPLGIERFTPILNPPQVGILGVGAIAPRAVGREGATAHRAQLGLSLTIDHQVVDGAPAARFLQTLAEHLADPERLLLA